MGFLSILGKLPASTSQMWTVNGLDLQKTLRFAIVVFVGAFCASIAAKGDLTALELKPVLTDAANAGVMAVGSAVVELLRRFASK